MLKVLIKAHTELMLNPFFEPSEGGGVSDADILECYDDDEDEDQKQISKVIGNSRYLDVFYTKLGDIASTFEKYF